MDDKDKEYLANLRCEYQETIGLLRHYDLILFGIIAFLIPTTTAGFAIKLPDKEYLIFIIGVLSVMSWVGFITVTIIYSRKELRQTKEHGKELQSKMKELIKKGGVKEEKGLIEVLEPLNPYINYGTLLFLMGVLICIMWGIFIFVEKLWLTLI